jgi:hypothetical protein
LVPHGLRWWLVEPEKLSSLANAAIQDPAATVFVSTATGWELATEVCQSNLPGGEGLRRGLELVVHAYPSQWENHRHESISRGIGRHRLCSHCIWIALLCFIGFLWIWMACNIQGLITLTLQIRSGAKPTG